MAQEEIQERIEQVSSWILEGQGNRDIEEALTAEGWTGNIEDILNKAYLHLSKISGNESARVAFHLEARRVLYQKCLAISDYKAAHAILQDIAKIENIYDKSPRTNINVGG